MFEVFKESHITYATRLINLKKKFWEADEKSNRNRKKKQKFYTYFTNGLHVSQANFQ